MHTILIVDDDQELVGLVTFHLKKNYKVFVAFDSIQAFQIMQKEHFDLILLDINLPAGSGFSLAEKMKMFPNLMNTPFIIISAVGDEANKERAQQLGAIDFIEKPYNIKDLTKVIEKTLSESVEHAT